MVHYALYTMNVTNTLNNDQYITNNTAIIITIILRFEQFSLYYGMPLQVVLFLGFFVFIWVWVFQRPVRIHDADGTGMNQI